MQQLSIEFNGAKEFKAALKAAPEVAQREIRKANYAAAYAVRGKVKQFAPVKTGALRTSIQIMTDGLVSRVTTDKPYAPFLEFGTKAHGPVSAPYLVFKINGRWVRTKRVRGIKARKFFARGFEAARRTVESAYDKMLDAIVSSLAA